MEIRLSDRKADLRARLALARTLRDNEQLTQMGASLAQRVHSLVPTRTVAAFIGVGTEPPTLPLIEALYAAGARVLLPVVRPHGTLDWADTPARDAVRTGPLGLLEPAGPFLGSDAVGDAGLLLVPALAVDRHGHRLGRGGGYYDRLLATVSRTGTARVVAVVFDDEVLDDVPVEPHDIAVDAALTPSGLIEFGGEQGREDPPAWTRNG